MPRVPPKEHQFKKGQSGNPNGRKPGVPNKYNMLSNEQRQQVAAMVGGLTPLELFISVARQEDVPMELRIEAAKNAAPYLHRKMPIAIEGGDMSRPINIMDVAQLKGLKTSELQKLMELLQKAGANLIGEDKK